MILVVAKFLPLALTPSDAAEFVGAQKLFDDMKAAGWIKACPNARNKMVLYDTSMLQAAYLRYRAGEYPTPKGTL